jgi:hypothetical protein
MMNYRHLLILLLLISVQSCRPLSLGSPVDSRSTQPEAESPLPIILTPTPTIKPNATHTPSPTSPITSPESTPTPIVTPEPPQTPNFLGWQTDQVLSLLTYSGIKVKDVKPVSPNTLGTPGILAVDALKVTFPHLLLEYEGLILIFNNPEDLLIAQELYTADLSTESSIDYWLYAKDNLLILVDNRIPDRKKLAISNVFFEAILNSVLNSVPQSSSTTYLPWNQFYPADRGQLTNPEIGAGQRTFNRWSDENLWYFGGATWAYQDPSGSTDPPFTFPDKFQGEPLQYFYVYHCEPQQNPNPFQDCLNMQIYTELLTEFGDPTFIGNWAHGGWKSLKRKPVEWTVYYRLDAFDGHCDKSYIWDHMDDSDLQYPDNKTPLLFRMPAIEGSIYVSDPVCAITYNSYEQRKKFILRTEIWRVVTSLMDSSYDAETDRQVIKAENYYYTSEQITDDDIFFKLWGHEIFWSRQVKPEAILEDGFQSFWWYTWDPPPTENADYDPDPTWNEYQWCRLDISKGPPGLGMLNCE